MLLAATIASKSVASAIYVVFTNVALAFNAFAIYWQVNCDSVEIEGRARMQKTKYLIVPMIIGLAACSQDDAQTADTSEPAKKFEREERSEPKTEGQRLARLGFDQVDNGGKGYLNTGDIETYRSTIFTSMDADDSKDISQAEFMSWDYGFSQVADEADRRSEYDTALKTVFSLWDRDADGNISEAEHRYAIRSDFDRIDINQNGILEEPEFLNGFSVFAAIRSALKPEPTTTPAE